MSDRDRVLILASTEFIDICQSQMALLTEALGAVWSAVYLTEGSATTQPTKLIPVTFYPQTETKRSEDYYPLQLPEIWPTDRQETRLLSGTTLSSQIEAESDRAELSEVYSNRRKQIIVPLLYQDLVMGLLVTKREDRDWSANELSRIDRIAKTLAIARILDRQQDWYEQQLKEEQQLRKIEHNLLDDLLHQLRSPLTALKTFSKLLIKRFLPEDPNHRVAKGILRESERLQELLQQFEEDLEVVATRTGESNNSLALTESNEPLLLPPKELTIETVALEPILESLFNCAIAIAQEKKIDLQIILSKQIPLVQANTRALTEVLSNLIDNAIKYTPAGGIVTIKAESSKKILERNFQGIQISDTGYGIPPQDRERLFQRNYRGVQAEGDIPGTGLGLAIAKNLVEQMNGRIEFISPNPNCQNQKFPGTIFWVWLLVED
jgi:signal transduction histidine kinase